MIFSLLSALTSPKIEHILNIIENFDHNVGAILSNIGAILE